MENEEIPYLLINRFLAGDLNDAEKAILKKWRAANSENEKRFLECQFVWNKSSLSQPSDDVSIDLDAALTKVHEQILPAVKPMNQGRRRFLQIASAAAAAMALFFIGFWGLTNNSVEQMIVKTSNEEQLKISLPDQSIVWLNENSILSYPKSFKENYREVKLTGDAVFEVVHDKTHPFIVNSEELSVKVLGTKFNVNTSQEDAILVHVINGKVQVENTINPKNSFIITKDQSVTYDSKIQKLALSESFDNNQLFWSTNTLTFSNSTLEKLFEDLRQHYDVDIQIQNTDFLSCFVNGKFKDNTVDEILESIQPIYNFKMQKNNSSVYKITEGKCN